MRSTRARGAVQLRTASWGPAGDKLTTLVLDLPNDVDVLDELWHALRAADVVVTHIQIRVASPRLVYEVHVATPEGEPLTGVRQPLIRRLVKKTLRRAFQRAAGVQTQRVEEG